MEYLSSVLVSTINGRVSLTEDRLCKSIFKISIQISMLMNFEVKKWNNTDYLQKKIKYSIG